MIAAQGSLGDGNVRPLSSLPRAIREVEHAFIPLADGTAARLPLLAAGRCRGAPGSRDPRVHPLLQARWHFRPRRGDAPLARGPRLLRDPGGHARERRVRRAPRRRVPRAGAGRRGRGDRLARGPALVLGSGRDVRQELGRLQQPTGGGAPAAGPQGHHHRVLDGRPLRGRHPHHGRLPVAGEPELGVHHARAQRAPARPAPRRRRAGARPGCGGWKTTFRGSSSGCGTSGGTRSGSTARCARTTPRSRVRCSRWAAGWTPTPTRYSD